MNQGEELLIAERERDEARAAEADWASRFQQAVAEVERLRVEAANTRRVATDADELRARCAEYQETANIAASLGAGEGTDAATCIRVLMRERDEAVKHAEEMTVLQGMDMGEALDQKNRADRAEAEVDRLNNMLSTFAVSAPPSIVDVIANGVHNQRLYNEGAAVECAAIVMWLRDLTLPLSYGYARSPDLVYQQRVLEAAADAIARGEHLTKRGE